MKPRVRIRSGTVVMQAIDAAEPNDALIDLLESLLADAKTGELQSLFYGAGWKGSLSSTGYSLSKHSNRHQMLASAHIGVAEFQDRIRTWHGDSVLNDEFGW